MDFLTHLSTLGITHTLLAISLFGLLGLSVLCPFIALLLHRFYSKNRSFAVVAQNAIPLSIEVIIPAHNEANVIGSTLSSIHRAIRYLKFADVPQPYPHVTIQVGADHCTDQTACTARQYPMVSVTEFSDHQGKWRILKSFCKESAADWVILVDAGTLWPETFLRDVLHQIHADTRVMAICPAYRPLKAGRLQEAVWFIEKALKKLEVLCGGPISVHGATVCYKASAIQRAFQYLGETRWLNDDVVLPLVLRTLYPQNIILYPIGEVMDAGIKAHKLDLQRRKRILFGNLQWIRTLFPNCFRQNPIAGIVAIRRLFRVLWAYWFVFIGLGIALTYHLVLPAFLLFIAAVIFSGTIRQLAGAAWVSLLTPIRILRPTLQMQEIWK